MKIRDEFPVTMPALRADNPAIPDWMLKKVMPRPDHWSGNTPRWRIARRMPAIYCALILKGNEPVKTPLSDVEPNYPGPYFETDEGVRMAQKEFVRDFFSLRGTARKNLISISRKNGGFML